MKVRMPSYQRGFELGQFVMIAALLVFVAITGMRLVPAYIQDNSIKHVFASIARDPSMQGASEADIRQSFERRASIDDISAINSNDIEIGFRGATPYLSASYAVKVPLVANLSFYMEFNPNSEQR